MPFQLAESCIVRDVQVMPSGEVCATFELFPTKQKTSPFQVTTPTFAHDCVVAPVRAVQVTPSGEVVIELLNAVSAAQNNEPFHPRFVHQCAPIVLDVQEVPPFEEVAQKVSPVATTTSLL